MKNEKLNIEELWDYSFELLREISQLFSSLANNKFLSSNNFIDINNKIQKAKNLGINVEKYEREITEFRKNLLNRKIQDKINQIQENMKSENLDTLDLQFEDIENNFLELKQDIQEITEIENSYYELKNIIKKAKLYRKILQSNFSQNLSSYDFDQIMWEILSLKDAWIEVWDLESLIMWD